MELLRLTLDKFIKGKALNMKLQRWKVVNADGEKISTITTTIDASRDIAYAKLKSKYPTGHYFLKLIKIRNNDLGCDVELGGVGTTLKYGTILITAGIAFYLAKKFNLFKGFAWGKAAIKDIVAAPETIAKWEDGEIGTRADNIDKIIGILLKKADNFNSEYGALNSEWQALKSKAISSYGKASYKKTFYESGKSYYIGGKSAKEKLMDELDRFRQKALTELRKLQAKKNFKIDSKWNVVGCIPCLF